jgi:molybdenum cofactor biosynthesis protein B
MSETAERHKAEAPKHLGFAVIICSTSRFRELSEKGRADDPSGDLIVKAIREAGHRVAMRRIVPDEKSEIQRALMRALKSRKTDVIITSGGTGISMRDVTIEAVQPLLDKELPGFGEIFRTLSYEEIGSAAVLTRALAGVAKGKAVFCLPGSPQSVSLALERIIIPEAGHIVKHAREE